MRGWERVRIGVRCAYGCTIAHQEWAWFARHPMIVCEDCAGKYGITRPTVEHMEVDRQPKQDAERRTK